MAAAGWDISGSAGKGLQIGLVESSGNVRILTRCSKNRGLWEVAHTQNMAKLLENAHRVPKYLYHGGVRTLTVSSEVAVSVHVQWKHSQNMRKYLSVAEKIPFLLIRKHGCWIQRWCQNVFQKVRNITSCTYAVQIWPKMLINAHRLLECLSQNELLNLWAGA